MLSPWLDNLIWDAAVLLAAVLLDLLLPEPPHALHPVVWTGRVTGALRRLAPRQPVAAFAFGCVMVVVVVGGAGAAAWFGLGALASLHPIAYVIGGAVALRTAFAVTGLTSAARRTGQALAEGRLSDARVSLRSLVSRDAAALTPPLVAAAAIESVAENTTDSFVAPWLAFALFGVPGAIAYRALNTMDSMVGYRGATEYLGKAAARLDDAVNLIPARLSALLLLASGWLARLPAGRAWRTMRSDRGATASPNAGVTMSVMAGLLGVRLEKPGHYVLGSELREPAPADIDRAVRIVNRTAVLAVVVALAVLAGRVAITG
ncbi:MAG: adenosylcobinamide-phosphate synthase CbiB [Chloroflexota bacterium]|nr:adenosylcobinamide-phosphate synthase CbiB [Chloroflexota bacterium]